MGMVLECAKLFNRLLDCTWLKACSNESSKNCNPIRDGNGSLVRFLNQWIPVTSHLTFQGHPKSKFISLFKSPCMISYLCLIQTMHLKWMVSELQSYENLWPWVWPFKVIQQQRSYHHLKAPIWWNSYLCLILCVWNEWFHSYKAMKVCDLEFDLSRSSNMKGHITI